MPSSDEIQLLIDGVFAIRQHLTQQEISLVTVTMRQLVTTIFNKSGSDGILDFSRKGMTIFGNPQLQILSR